MHDEQVRNIREETRSVVLLAHKYLSAQPSTISDERPFSELGNVYQEKLNSLLPQNGEKLFFLHHNLTKFDSRL